MDIHLEDRLNHLLFSLLQLNFFLPALVFFHTGISLEKKPDKNNKTNKQINKTKKPQTETTKASKWDFTVLNSQQNV